ncbi:tRNA preQ1(34) S-adenosylmethionine ribosyltransferase-isomerase QueA [Polymorphobacter megasporae]|uniref:tRNA preQ1(34) S-adenosylmethionine ribosyltransferase-isomerase QueA n=1 Tax=Glacieibacterium megasporae TaxID=2835787 RepID=UPI001C1E38C1|nr:tRNA preQ1(34) S-adenosylmethionine ribosyltransferase-isomerase QueA [Polymorphobacter megasporae]UAJ09701.1 tRNA preQ1(34) S-adenosylmethionine ribosyltransferase-isomerase QueA [Polymorphobacter megasporae]
MRVADFDFDLPADRIALRPVVPRDAARLLVVTPDGLSDRGIADLPGLLRAGDCLVFNDTRVIPAQLAGMKHDAKIRVTLHKREDHRVWWSFVKNAKRLKIGDRIDFGGGLSGLVEARGEDGSVRWRFDSALPFEEALAAAGQMPLPPYISSKRAVDAQDLDDYQTVYATKPGAVAAPTAGLHFTPDLLAALDAAGVTRETVTLHVGAGTFLPVKADDTDDHAMHAEWGSIDAATTARIVAARNAGGRIIAVGTTSARLLESAWTPDGLGAWAGDTRIFITPGFRFAMVDGLLTNFHLPKSTLFMLVSALMGLETMRAAYAHAVAEEYRFYSYGDASLLLP